MAPPRIKKAPPKVFLGGALAPPRLKKRVEAWQQQQIYFIIQYIIQIIQS